MSTLFSILLSNPFLISRGALHALLGASLSGINYTIRSDLRREIQGNLPSANLLGVLVDPSSSNSEGPEGGGVWTRETLDFLDIGADIEGLREFDKLNGLPSSESLSPAAPVIWIAN